MSTPQDLKAAFSFIGAFQSETVLAPYTHNALPLFAVGLYLGIEDLASFAIDSLTDAQTIRRQTSSTSMKPKESPVSPKERLLRIGVKPKLSQTKPVI